MFRPLLTLGSYGVIAVLTADLHAQPRPGVGHPPGQAPQQQQHPPQNRPHSPATPSATPPAASSTTRPIAPAAAPANSARPTPTGPLTTNIPSTSRPTRVPATGAPMGTGLNNRFSPGAIPPANRPITAVVIGGIPFSGRRPIIIGAPFGGGQYGQSVQSGTGGAAVPTGTVVATETPVATEAVATTDGTAGSEWGLKILEVVDGGKAKDADLRAGDIILAVGPTRVQTFEELRTVLSTVNASTDIIFINGENGKVERISAKPVDGKLGVSVEPIVVQ